MFMVGGTDCCPRCLNVPCALRIFTVDQSEPSEISTAVTKRTQIQLVHRLFVHKQRHLSPT